MIVSPWAGFIAGLFIGGFIGVFAMVVLIAGDD